MTTPSSPPGPGPSHRRTRWAEIAGADSGRAYADRFAALAAEGKDTHGEATFCATLLEPGARVLDAGCGTGRVAVRLSELGFDCVGVDVDGSMLAVARESAPSLSWVQADLATLTLEDVGGQPFDLVVLAGNVVPLLAPGTLAATVRATTGLLRPSARVVAGFGLAESQLPQGCPVTPLADYDTACATNGLVLEQRFSTWDGAEFDESCGYAVSVHYRRNGEE